MLVQIRDIFFWPGLKRDVMRWVQCKRRKTPRPLRAGIRTAALAKFPNEVMAMDIFGPMHISPDGKKMDSDNDRLFYKMASADPDQRQDDANDRESYLQVLDL